MATQHNGGVMSRPKKQKRADPSKSASFKQITTSSSKTGNDATNASSIKRPLPGSKTGNTGAPGAGESRKPVPSGKRSHKHQDWLDIPVWTHTDSPFMRLPVEILDRIVDGDSGLAIQDHLALSGTCRMIRAAYTDSVWNVLFRSFPTLAIDDVPSTDVNFANRLFSNAMERLLNGKKPERSGQTAFGSQENLVRLRRLANGKISDPAAKELYKVSKADLAPLKYTMNNWYGGAKVRYYKLAAVRALALKIHGGPIRHEKYAVMLEARLAKAKATHERNLKVYSQRSDLR